MQKNLVSGEKVRLTANMPGDVELLQKWFSDPDFFHQYHGSDFQFKTKKDVEEGENAFDSRWNQRFFRIRPAGDSNQLLGQIALFNIDWVDRKGTLAVYVDPNETGKGYGSEAIRLVLNYAFSELNLNRVELWVYAYNTRAYALYERLGFVNEGRTRQAIYVAGRYHDSINMAVLREEWEAKTEQENPEARKTQAKDTRPLIRQDLDEWLSHEMWRVMIHDRFFAGSNCGCPDCKTDKTYLKTGFRPKR